MSTYSNVLCPFPALRDLRPVWNVSGNQKYSKKNTIQGPGNGGGGVPCLEASFFVLVVGIVIHNDFHVYATRL